MGFLQRFGSRNHPKTREIQKARAGQAVPEETVVKYTAARAFLFSEWIGALLMIASFTQLYYGVLSGRYSTVWAVGAGIAILALGGWMFWRSHTYYTRLDFPWRKKWDNAAIVVAGAGVIFWLLFAILAALTVLGVSVLPKGK